MKIIRPKSIHLCASNLASVHFGDFPVPSRLNKTYSQVIDEGLQLLDPVIGYKVLKPKSHHGLIEVMAERGKHVLPSLVLSNLLGEIDYLCIGFCTIGPRLEMAVSEYVQKEKIGRAYILDAFGSYAAVDLIDRLNRMFFDEGKAKGLFPGPLFMPGNGPLELELQKTISRIIPIYKLGITVTDQCLLVPLKSVSVICGLSKYLEQSCMHECQKCDKQDNCYLRKIKIMRLQNVHSLESVSFKSSQKGPL